MHQLKLIFKNFIIVLSYCDYDDDDDATALLTCVTLLSQDGKTLVKVRGSAPSSRK